MSLNANSLLAPYLFEELEETPSMYLTSIHELLALCLALGAGRAGLTPAEVQLASKSKGVRIPRDVSDKFKNLIQSGADPLGDSFARLRPASARRASGAIYTPQLIVDSMISWIGASGSPTRIVDPGAGSGRFVVAAGLAFPKARLVAIEVDPTASLMLKANLAAHGLLPRATVLVKDFRKIELPRIKGSTAFVGNPPYVRHHNLLASDKAWYQKEFSALGISASSLAGMHLHFFLKAKLLGKKGDIGAFITSAEWLDVGYGAALRKLFLGELGGSSLQVLEPTVEAFPGTATTAAIACFKIGSPVRSVRMRSVAAVAKLNGLSTGKSVKVSSLLEQPKWSILIKSSPPKCNGALDLGELFRVHRGQVTGANRIWIAGPESTLVPEAYLRATVTKARELIQVGRCLSSDRSLRRIVDLPLDLDEMSVRERLSVTEFLSWARRNGAHESYVATHRKAWWSVGLRDPAPILCTYMARRPPQFTLNACKARHINIAHGLYPREELPSVVMERLVDWLNQNVLTGNGRTYAGGLTKFEPREVERLRIPAIEELSA